MRPQSAKAKGRRLQQELAALLLKYASHLTSDDVQSRSMGAQGEDLMLSAAARKIYPFSFECKNTERLNIWDAIDQARRNSRDHIPAVAFKRNRSDVYIALRIEDLLTLLQGRPNSIPHPRNTHTAKPPSSSPERE